MADPPKTCPGRPDQRICARRLRPGRPAGQLPNPIFKRARFRYRHECRRPIGMGREAVRRVRPGRRGAERGRPGWCRERPHHLRRGGNRDSDTHRAPEADDPHPSHRRQHARTDRAAMDSGRGGRAAAATRGLAATTPSPKPWSDADATPRLFSRRQAAARCVYAGTSRHERRDEPRCGRGTAAGLPPLGDVGAQRER
jgi:hypothetical protein